MAWTYATSSRQQEREEEEQELALNLALGDARLELDSGISTARGNRVQNPGVLQQRMAGNRGWPSRGIQRTPFMAKRTVRDLVSDLLKMGDAELTALQVKLYDAGMYGESRPIWGVPSKETVDAFVGFLGEAASRPDMTYHEVMRQFIEAGDGDTLAALDGDGPGGGDNIVDLSDPTEIRNAAQQYAEQELGMKLSDDQLAVLVGATHAREKQNALQRYEMTGGSGGVGDEELTRFMRALSGVESGGDPTVSNSRTGAHGTYQILPSNWPRWAKMAGLSPDAPKTPENQELVARTVLRSYYKKFGNWRDVAVAWYAGPGRVERARQGDIVVQGGKEPSVHEYANTVLARMDKVDTSDLKFNTNESFDLEQGVRNLDPARAAAKDFSNTMNDFFTLLAGSE